MKRLSIILTAIALVLGMAQCKKTIKQITPGGGDGVYVTVTAGCDGAKTDIAATGITKWSAGDKLYVVGATQGYLGCLTIVNYSDANPSNWAEFAGNITAISPAQDIHFYYFGKQGLTAAEVTSLGGGTTTHTYSIATQDGTLDGIENTMHLVHGSKTNVTEGTTKFGNVTMSNMMAIARFDISGYAYPSAICNAIASASLNLKTGELSPGSAADITLSNPSENYYMALIPSETAQTFSFKQNASDLNPVTKSRTIAAGKFYVQDGNSITVKHGVPGALIGEFSVAADRKVRFSQGNLWCNTGSYTWAFENNQWDRSIPTTWNAGHSGHFYWTSNNYGAAQTYTSSGDGSLDWGVVVASQLGEGWATLSYTEWEWLIVGRTNHASKIGPATVHSVEGVVILPDDFTEPYSGCLTSYSSGATSYSTNTYDDGQWNQMEAAGAVFLPRGGYRDGDGIELSQNGYYWSSTQYSTDHSYLLYFDNGSCNVSGEGNMKSHGRYVRLVREASNGGGGAEPFGGTNW